jgi:TonB family protein
MAFASVAPPPPPPAPVRATQIDQPKSIINQTAPLEAPADIAPEHQTSETTQLLSAVEGTVIVEATIGPNGKVQDAKVLRSHPLLEAAALDADRQWEFTPTFVERKSGVRSDDRDRRFQVAVRTRIGDWDLANWKLTTGCCWELLFSEA